MTTEMDDHAVDGSRPGPSRRASWARWIVAVVVVTAITSAGGWVIGLAPEFVVGLIGALVATSFVWMVVAHRRRDAAVSSLGVAVRMAVTGGALLLAIQAVPIGRDHPNPTVTGEPAWSSPRTRELMVAACYSCHSNEVEWPWYSNIAPMSWAIDDHVEEGRAAVNFSEFATNPREAEESIEEILDGSMPPAYFTRFGLHSDAALSADEQEELIAGLRATPGFGEDEGSDARTDDDDEADEDDDED